MCLFCYFAFGFEEVLLSRRRTSYMMCIICYFALGSEEVLLLRRTSSMMCLC